MAREAQKTDFTVDVEGIGSFTFARRTMRDEIRIQREFARIIDGVEPTAWLELVGGWISDLGVLTVEAPEGWDIEGMDPLDDDTFAKMAKVHAALRNKEKSFRGKSAPDSKEQRPGTGQDDRVLVPPALQADQ